MAKAADSSKPERRLARAINQGAELMTAGAMSQRAMAQAMAGDVDGFIDALPWDEYAEHMTTEALPALTNPMEGAALAESRAIKSAISLNALDDLSKRYAQQQAGTMIVNITNTQRDTIRNVLGEAFDGTLTKDQAARKIRQGIGLHPRWAQAVKTFEEKQRARPRPTGYSPARWEQTVQKRTQTYYDRLLRRRADIIARTEIQTAENLGRYATWADSVAKGMNGMESRKEWSSGPGACPQICADLAGEIVRWDQPFRNGSLMPPGHPGCRCTAVLLPAPYKNPALNPRPINWTDRMGNRFEIDPDKYEDGYKLLAQPPKVKAPKRISTDRAAAETPDVATRAFRPVSQESKEALTDYVNLGYDTMNMQLRGQGALTPANKALAEKIDDAIARQAPLEQDIIVYRGARMTDLAGNQTGKDIFDGAYMSTSATRAVAEGFRGFGDDVVLIEIRVPAGQRVIAPNLRRQTGDHPDNRNLLLDNEAEILLPRNTTIHIIEDIEQIGPVHPFGAKPRIIRAEVVPDAPKPKPKPRSDADDLTYDSTAHWSDDKLADKITFYAENGDDAALDRIFEIIDERAERAVIEAAKNAEAELAAEQIAARAAQAHANLDAKYRAEAEASRARLEEATEAQRLAQAAEAANNAKGAGQIIPDPDPVRNPAIRPNRALTAKEQAGEQYQDYLNTQMARALDDLNGVFFNRASHAEARARGFTEETLFTAPWQVANKYASEELKEWWLANGRESLKSFRYKITQNQSDKWAADNVRKRGHETGQAKRDRSIF